MTDGIDADAELRSEAGVAGAARAGEGRDVVAAAGGELVGTARRDVLRGDDGQNRLTGGLGADQLTGGGGADVFVYGGVADSTRERADRIMDFTVGEDTLDLSAVDADSTRAGDQSFSFIGTQRFSGEAGELRVSMRGGVLSVIADVDGDGQADFHIRIDGLPSISEAEFLV